MLLSEAVVVVFDEGLGFGDAGFGDGMVLQPLRVMPAFAFFKALEFVEEADHAVGVVACEVGIAQPAPVGVVLIVATVFEADEAGSAAGQVLCSRVGNRQQQQVCGILGGD